MSPAAEGAAIARLAESAHALRDPAEPGSKLKAALCEFSDALTAVLCPVRDPGVAGEAHPAVAGARRAAAEAMVGSRTATPATQLHEAGHA